jgi:hypothetical protein
MATIQTPDGMTHDATQIDFKQNSEHSAEFELEDGTKIQIRCVMIDVAKSDKYNKSGEPIYFPTFQNICRIIVNKDLLKEPEEIVQRESIDGYR